MNTSSWVDRRDAGYEHEDCVVAALRETGWQAELMGQRLQPEIFAGTSCRARFEPDIRARMADMIVFADAKDGRTDTLNWCVEVEAFWFLGHFQALYGAPVVFIWPDLTWSFHEQIKLDRCRPHDGMGTNGSGTPFWLVPKSSLPNAPLSSLALGVARWYEVMA